MPGAAAMGRSIIPRSRSVGCTGISWMSSGSSCCRFCTWLRRRRPVASAHHVIPPRTYVLVFVILIVFTLLTVGIDLMERADILHLPEGSHTWVSLSIATIKATLVILFF